MARAAATPQTKKQKMQAITSPEKHAESMPRRILTETGQASRQ
jgi:hypothetical protein